jgi:monofunctional biosynthetic peptidoglycan transglycosylase
VSVRVPKNADSTSRPVRAGRLALLGLAGLLGGMVVNAAETPRLLFDFRAGTTNAAWQAVNDDVMGGISRSQFQTGTNGVAVFRGEVSLENNGGFASVRSPAIAAEARGADGFRLRVRGDGRRYKFTARTEGGFDSVLYQKSFATRAGEWIEVVVPFTELAPTFRGRVLTDAPKFDAAELRSVGFLISDRQAGLFVLEIEWIGWQPVR